MKKVLDYKVIDSDCAYIFVKITEQSHTCRNFGKDFRFQASNGIRLISNVFPEFISGDEFYVRGDNPKWNDTVMNIPHKHFANFVKAVKEYNEFDFYEAQPTAEELAKYFAKSGISNRRLGKPFIVQFRIPEVGEYYVHNEKIIECVCNHKEMSGGHPVPLWIVQFDDKKLERTSVTMLKHLRDEYMGKHDALCVRCNQGLSCGFD